ncbi:PAS domain-containing sensor histidine kinase [Telmatospirillum sp. J64-1]|uniref:PAS domain-containing sensor histidine kinase n=1 Tax=Telmatospirillum sp. J64-1 TaxID=2502183 RepID=UPI00163D839A|nr:ATP-binding protein [Telmatospirillum sp. J64-1]
MSSLRFLPTDVAGEALGMVLDEGAFGDFLDAVPAHVAVLDRKGTVLAVNAAWTRFAALNGIDPALSGVGADYLSLYAAIMRNDPAEAEEIVQGVRSVLDGLLANYQMEYAFLAGPVRRWFRCYVSPLHRKRLPGTQGDGTERVLQGALVMHVDITDRKLAEEEALLAAERIRLIADSVPALVSYVDADEIFQFVNRRYEEFYGLPAEDIVGKRLSDLLGETVYNRIKPDVDRVLAGHPARFEGISQVDGESWYCANLVPHVSADGRVLGYFTLVQDISEHKRLEQELTEAKARAERNNAAKSDFLANMSHELRTPLNAILGFSEVLTGQFFGPLGHARYAEYAADIHFSGQHLLGLINDILDLSKIEAGRMELHEERVDLDEEIRHVLSMLADRAARGGVSLQRDLPERMPAVRGDVRLLRQALLNLLSNAVKFTPPGGCVVLGMRHEDGMLCLEVRDNGMGIPADKIATVLEPFGQAGNSALSGERGTGLGLPLARRFIELHGGRLNLSSTVGRGTTVTIMLPLERVLADR